MGKAESKNPIMKNFYNKGNGEGGKLNQCSPVFLSPSGHRKIILHIPEVKKDGGCVYITSSGHRAVVQVLYVTSGPKHRKTLCPIPLL